MENSLAQTLAQFEQSHKCQEWAYQEVPIWPLLRIYYFYALRSRHASGGEMGAQNTKRQFDKLKTALQGFFRLHRKRRFLFLSDSSENRPVGTGLKNKIFIPFWESLDWKEIEYFENPTQTRWTHLPVENPPLISTATIDLLAFALHFFIKKPAVKGREHRDEFARVHSLRINEDRILRLHLAYRLVFRWLLRSKKPELIFLTESYSNCHMALIAEAKRLRIPTIELQHGVINREHPAYNRPWEGPPQSELYPDELWAHGPYVARELKEQSWIEPHKIKSMGHPYLDFLLREGPPSQRPTWLKASTPVCLVTLQWTDQQKVIPFLHELAVAQPNVQFVLLPRSQNGFPYPLVQNLPANLQVDWTSDFYVALQFCSVHCTTYSTTALEAPIFGKPNLLLNFENMAKLYFGNLLIEGPTHAYANHLQQASTELSRLLSVDSQQVKSSAALLIEPNFKQNLHAELRSKEIAPRSGL